MSKKRRVLYDTSIKNAYVTELRKMQERMSGLREKLENAIGDGQITDQLDWSDVSKVTHINQLLYAALSVEIKEA